MGTVTKPFTFADLDIIDALKFNNNFDTLYGEFNGNIDNANIKSLAGIEGTKIAPSPNGIPTDRLNNDAVTDVKLSDHASADASRAVGELHIKTDAVVKRIIKAANVSLNKLDVLVEAKAFSIATTFSNLWIVGVSRKTNGANYEASFYAIAGSSTSVFDTAGGTGGIAGLIAGTIVPTTAIPTATREIIGLYLANIVFTASTSVAGDCIFISIART